MGKHQGLKIFGIIAGSIVVAVLFTLGVTGNLHMPQLSSQTTGTDYTTLKNACNAAGMSWSDTTLKCTATGGNNYLPTGTYTIAVSGTDAQASGTSVVPTVSSSINDAAFSTTPTTIVPGQTLAMVLNKTGYHSAYVPSFTASATSFPVPVKFNNNATVTENIYSTTGTVLTNGAGANAVNQTNGGNGASYTLKDEMSASALTSTQDMVCVIEITAGNNASSTPPGAILSGSINGVAVTAAGTSKPVWYSVAGTNSNVYLFNVPAISTPSTQTLYINLNSKSTGAFPLGGKMIKSCYTKEWFIDPNTGKATFDVADSNGNLKSIATYTYTIEFV